MPYITDVSSINDYRYLYISVDPQHPLKMFQYLTSLCSHRFTEYYEIPLRNCVENVHGEVFFLQANANSERIKKSDLPPEIQALLTLIGHS